MDTLKALFLGEEGLRSGWRVLAFAGPGLLFTLLAGVAAGGLLAAVSAMGVTMPPEAQIGASVLIYAVFPLWSLTCSALLDGNGARGAGMGGPAGRSVLELGIGWGVGGVLNAGGLALLAALGATGLVEGSVALEASSLSAREAVFWVGWMALFCVAATWEEVLFRGYGLLWAGRSLERALGVLSARGGLALSTRLAKGLGHAPVVFLSCLFFSLVHLGNPGNAGLFPVVNTMLAGLWLVISVYRTRGLWAAIGMHWGWNATMGLVLGVPVSGMGNEESGMSLPGLLQTTLSGPDWYTGAAYGLEGSAACTVVLLAGCVLGFAWPAADGRPVI